MYNFSNSPYKSIKKRVNKYNPRKIQCIQLEKDIFNFINLIRREPYKYIEFFQKANNYNDNSTETEQIFNYINNLSQNHISLSPLYQIPELTKISSDLLNYLINIKKKEGIIKYNNLEEEYINLRMRAAPYGIIRGKYYEAIVLDSTNLLEIISYIMKDIKGRNVLFYEKIKYIGIACGYFETFNNTNNFKICTIIDMIQDFDLNYTSINNNIFINEKYKNKTPEVFMRIKSVFKDKKKNFNNNKNDIQKCHSFDKTPKSTDRIRKYHKLNIDNCNNFHINKSFETQNIFIKKDPLLTYDNNNFSTEFPSLTDNNRIKDPYFLYKKLSSLRYKDKNKSNIYNNNSLYYSFKYNFDKMNNKRREKYISDNLSENIDKTYSYFNKAKSPKKKLNREERIELLKQLNKISRDKSKNKKSNLKTEDDNKTISINTKKNTSNDISLSDITSIDNEKKNKEEKEKKNLLKNQLKNEIKKEIEKEVKEELKAELINKVFFTSPKKNIKKETDNLIIPINNDFDIKATCNFGLSNNNINEDKNNDIYNKKRNISSIDIFFPTSSIKTDINIQNSQSNSNTNSIKKDNFIMKKLIKIHNNKNSNGESNKQIIKNNSFNYQNNNNIYHKITIMSNSLYYNNKKDQNNIHNNKTIINKKIFIPKNKMININYNSTSQSLCNSKSISPKPRSKIPRSPFKKIIVKSNNNNMIKNEVITLDKIIKIPKKIVKDINYFDKNSIIINNKTNNTVYIKQIYPKRTTNFENSQIYRK